MLRILASARTWGIWKKKTLRAFSHTQSLVWTPCLMHRCVCIWRYILQNYNYKLHFQNLFIYSIPYVSIGTLAAENLDICSACDPWDSNIQLAMGNRLETANIPQRCSMSNLDSCLLWLQMPFEHEIDDDAKSKMQSLVILPK
jgi:hypothetical protein